MTSHKYRRNVVLFKLDYNRNPISPINTNTNPYLHLVTLLGNWKNTLII
jgi:hypothetical protein